MIAPAGTVRWGEIVDGRKTYPLHRAQADVLRSRSRFVAAFAGTGGGKTAIGPLWVANEIRRLNRPILGIVLAPTYQVLQRATVRTLIETFAHTDLQGVYQPSKSRYFLGGGMGELWCLGADRPWSIEGGQFDLAWIDEGGQIKYDAWVAIQGRIGAKLGRCLITSTPYARNWCYHDFEVRALQGDPDYYVRRWASIANPTYPRAEYERARRTMARHRFEMRYNGLFTQAAGLVYPDLASCIVDPYEPPDGTLVGGMDFGWNDPFAAVAGTLYVAEDTGKTNGDPRDVLYMWYERYRRRTHLWEHAQALPSGVTWYADPSRPDSIDDLRRADVIVRKADNDIIRGIDAVNARLYDGRLKISRLCRAVIAEAELYGYPLEEDEPKGDRPVDENNHALDALRYGVMGIDRRRVAQRSGEYANSA